MAGATALPLFVISLFPALSIDENSRRCEKRKNFLSACLSEVVSDPITLFISYFHRHHPLPGVSLQIGRWNRAKERGKEGIWVVIIKITINNLVTLCEWHWANKAQECLLLRQGRQDSLSVWQQAAFVLLFLQPNADCCRYLVQRCWWSALFPFHSAQQHKYDH